MKGDLKVKIILILIKNLIGKKLDIIMPEIFHKQHKKVLQNSVNEF